jgi:hypothetical protein
MSGWRLQLALGRHNVVPPTVISVSGVNPIQARQPPPPPALRRLRSALGAFHYTYALLWERWSASRSRRIDQISPSMRRPSARTRTRLPKRDWARTGGRSPELRSPSAYFTRWKVAV